MFVKYMRLSGYGLQGLLLSLLAVTIIYKLLDYMNGVLFNLG
jgi:hypothetical protein